MARAHGTSDQQPRARSGAPPVSREAGSMGKGGALVRSLDDPTPPPAGTRRHREASAGPRQCRRNSRRQPASGPGGTVQGGYRHDPSRPGSAGIRARPEPTGSSPRSPSGNGPGTTPRPSTAPQGALRRPRATWRLRSTELLSHTSIGRGSGTRQPTGTVHFQAGYAVGGQLAADCFFRAARVSKASAITQSSRTTMIATT